MSPRAQTAAQLISGAIAMGYAVIGLFFLRFWRETRDRLFAAFAVAFWVLGLQRVLLSLAAGAEEESRAAFYLLRLGAFALILIAILDKNRARKA